LSFPRIRAAPSLLVQTRRTPPLDRRSIADTPTFSDMQRITTTPSSPAPRTSRSFVNRPTISMLTQSASTTCGVPLPNGESRKTSSCHQTRVQLRKALLKQSDVFRIGRLQLAQTLLVDVRHLAGLDRCEKLNEPISLVVPVFRTHDDAPPVAGNTRTEVS
jgi:hypothetical protein